MTAWNTLRRFETKRFTVALQWEQEQDQDVSWADSADLARIDSGEWTNCCFRVAVYLDDREIAASYLGNSVYEDPADFGREHLGSNRPGVGRGYFSDMVREAIGEARRRIAERPAPLPMPRVRHRSISI